MKKLCLLFALGFLFAACKKKEKEVDKNPKALHYRIVDSNYRYFSYTVGPDGYKRNDYQLSFPVDYPETVTIDTFSDLKQLTYRGVSFPRSKNSVNTFTLPAPNPLPGNYISILLRNDSIFINCEIERWQTWQKYYTLTGKLR